MLSHEESKNMNAQEFSVYGLHNMAYIKKETKDQKEFYSIFAADGTQLAMAKTANEAQELVERNDMQPLLAH
jgi:hypothetical protein